MLIWLDINFETVEDGPQDSRDRSRRKDRAVPTASPARLLILRESSGVKQEDRSIRQEAFQNQGDRQKRKEKGEGTPREKRARRRRFPRSNSDFFP
jgi:hypothetical protein